MDITSANSTSALIITGLFPVAQILQGYSTDDAFAADDVAPAQVMMGVDGKQSGGYVPYPVKLDYTFQADSPSLALFDALLAAQAATRSIFLMTNFISLPSVRAAYTFNKGILTSASPLPKAAKVLQPRKFSITFESMNWAPI
ncbi:phage tail fiber protein [Paraburkholderia elongata]|uniref:Uncharacterized protein n=1 Tax=Paraburkholderia elongata TaxID=2675747 RepID=A0A972NWW3_9BURK|nr:hypothetical protein [Paraburkholderia elongata]NPT59105.1 hypothetical protein [Paraburkholderia elongata]